MSEKEMRLNCNGLPQKILYFKKKKYFTVLKRLHGMNSWIVFFFFISPVLRYFRCQ